MYIFVIHSPVHTIIVLRSFLYHRFLGSVIDQTTQVLQKMAIWFIRCVYHLQPNRRHVLQPLRNERRTNRMLTIAYSFSVLSEFPHSSSCRWFFYNFITRWIPFVRLFSAFEKLLKKLPNIYWFADKWLVSDCGFCY